MGAVAKGVASLFGGRKRRQTEKDTKRDFEAAERNVQNFNFTNPMEGLSGRTITPGTFDPLANKAQVATMDPRTDVGQVNIGSATGYADKVQGYGDQLTDFTAQQTNISGLARGAATGLTNTMNNLQVSTAGSELAAREADQSLAASQDLAAQAGTGAGGATALAAAAAKAKSGISADIDRQVKSNEMMRARGESELQRAQLAQGNLASQFDLGQSQFNVGAQNQAEQFNAQAANQAARFQAQAANQFQMAQFGADTARERANAASANQFAQQKFGAANQFALANMAAQNQGEQFNIGQDIAAQRFGAQTDIRAQELAAQGAMGVQQMEFAREQDTLNRRAGQYQAAKDARAQATADAIGGIGGILDAGMMAISPGGILNKSTS